MKWERIKVSERKGNQTGSMERNEWTPQWRKAGFKEVREGKQREPF